MARKRQQTKPRQAVRSAEQRAAEAARAEKVRRVQVTLGYCVVGGTVLAAVGAALTRQIPWPVSIGLTLLALFRGVALHRELRREGGSEASDEQKADPYPRSRVAVTER